MHRLRWRRRGEWLWPSFVALTVADAIIGHELPPQGQTQSLVAAALLGIVLNVIAVILLSRPLANVWRRARPGLPEMIARDYAGRLVLVSVTGALTIVGIVHRPAILQQQRAMRDAVVRAQAWIGDRAPATFRRNVAFADTFTIEAAHLYRICVPSDDRTRTYCVVVDAKLPFERSVSFAGYESNAVFAAGAG
jgi:hypothetical protein